VDNPKGRRGVAAGATGDAQRDVVRVAVAQGLERGRSVQVKPRLMWRGAYLRGQASGGEFVGDDPEQCRMLGARLAFRAVADLVRAVLGAAGTPC